MYLKGIIIMYIGMWDEMDDNFFDEESSQEL